MAEFIEDSQGLESTTIGIYRTAAVVKGGRRFSFSALVVVGDRRGNVGIGYGKASGVPNAIEKAQKNARKRLHKVSLKEGTIPHQVYGRFGASQVRLLPAAPGTGVIAGGTVRAVLEMAGVKDCLSKGHGSTNPKNLCLAAIDGLLQLRTKEEVALLRGVDLGTTATEEKLAIGAKYAPKVSSGPVVARPVNNVGKSEGGRGGRGGRGGGGRGRRPETVVAEEPKPPPAAAGEAAPAPA